MKQTEINYNPRRFAAIVSDPNDMDYFVIANYENKIRKDEGMIILEDIADPGDIIKKIDEFRLIGFGND